MYDTGPESSDVPMVSRDSKNRNQSQGERASRFFPFTRKSRGGNSGRLQYVAWSLKESMSGWDDVHVGVGIHTWQSKPVMDRASKQAENVFQFCRYSTIQHFTHLHFHPDWNCCTS